MIDVGHTQIARTEIMVSCDDFGSLHASLPRDEVPGERGHVVYLNGTRWVVEDYDAISVFLVFRPLSEADQRHGETGCAHLNIVGTGHGQTMQCADCGFVFRDTP